VPGPSHNCELNGRAIVLGGRAYLCTDDRLIGSCSISDRTDGERPDAWLLKPDVSGGLTTTSTASRSDSSDRGRVNMLVSITGNGP
jgi:hypothetical protein